MLLAKGNYICIILNPVPPKPRNIIPLLQFLFLCFNFVYSTVGVEIDILNAVSCHIVRKSFLFALRFIELREMSLLEMSYI